MMRSTSQFLIAAVTVGLLLFVNQSNAEVAPVWSTPTAYVVGDFVRLGDPANTTYKCTVAHTSAFATMPPHANWTKVWPDEAPVANGGAGDEGNDWLDFGFNFSIPWRDAQDVPHVTTSPALFIYKDNPNHILANHRVADGTRITHVLIKDNYDDINLPTAEAGNAHWNWFYRGHTPVVVLDSDCDTSKNCVSICYHNYKGATTAATNWVNLTAADAGPYVDELTEVAASGDNGGHETQAGDRCHSLTPAHCWIIEEVDCHLRKHRWKNNVSGIYMWDNSNADLNDGAHFNGSFIETFSIYRK